MHSLNNCILWPQQELEPLLLAYKIQKVVEVPYKVLEGRNCSLASGSLS